MSTCKELYNHLQELSKQLDVPVYWAHKVPESFHAEPTLNNIYIGVKMYYAKKQFQWRNCEAVLEQSDK
jgi:hypothetical protein